MQTLKSSKDFSKVFHTGRRWSGRYVRVCVVTEDEGIPSQVAFVAPKKLGCAVLRNRCKRLLRAAFHMVDAPSKGHKIILFATRHTPAAHPQEIAQSLETMYTQLGI